MARCQICSGDTGSLDRMHRGPDDCLRVITEQIAIHEENLAWLRQRRTTILEMMQRDGVPVRDGRPGE